MEVVIKLLEDANNAMLAQCPCLRDAHNDTLRKRIWKIRVVMQELIVAMDDVLPAANTTAAA
jgi:hypothetical protein